MRRTRLFGAGLAAMLVLCAAVSSAASADRSFLGLAYPHTGEEVPRGAAVEGSYILKITGYECTSSGLMTMGFQTGKRDYAEEGMLPVPSCEADGGGAPSGLQVQGGAATEIVVNNKEGPHQVLELSTPIRLQESEPNPACVYESKTKIAGTLGITKVHGYKELRISAAVRLRRKPPSAKTCAKYDSVTFVYTVLSGGEPLEVNYTPL